MVDWEYEATHSSIDVIKQHIDHISGQFSNMDASKLKDIADNIYDGVLLMRGGTDVQRMTFYQNTMRHFYDKWLEAWMSSNNLPLMNQQFNHLRDLGTWFPQEYRDNGLTIDAAIDMWNLIEQMRRHPTSGTLFERRQEDQKLFWSFFNKPIDEFKYLLDVLYDNNSDLIKTSLCEKIYYNIGNLSNKKDLFPYFELMRKKLTEAFWNFCNHKKTLMMQYGIFLHLLLRTKIIILTLDLCLKH